MHDAADQSEPGSYQEYNAEDIERMGGLKFGG
jgi:hypothetical protein